MAESWNPLSGLRVNPNTDPARAYQPESGKTINTPYTSITHYVDSAVQNMPVKAPAPTSYLTATPLASITQPVVENKKPLVKSATPEIILFDEDTVPIEIMTDLIFENIGGQEVLSLTRHDIVSGDFIPNQLIKNVSVLNQSYSSRNILGIQSTSDKYFGNYSIKLENKIPSTAGGPNNINIYIEDETGDLIVEVVNMLSDEEVEIQIGLGGTIYDTEF
jgi:hypothetical protein